MGALAAANGVSAGNIWDGGDFDDNLWSSPDNWDNNVAPIFPVDLVFGGTIRLAPTNDLAGLTVNGFTFNVGGGPFAIAGNAFTLAGPIVNNSANAQSINNNITLAATQTVTATGGVVLGGNIGDGGNAFGLTKAGAGTLTLAGANTFTGPTTLNVGTLNVGSSGALGATGPISFTGGTLQYSALNQADYSARFATAQTYRVDTNGQNVTWASALTGTGGAVVKSGAGTLTLSGNNTFTGALTLSANGGTVIMSGNNSGRVAGASNLTVVNSGATLQLQANAGNTTAGISTALSAEQTGGNPLILNNGSTVQLRSNSNVTFAGANNFGGVGNAIITFDVNNNGSGTGNTLTFAPANFNVSNTTFNVTGGNGYVLRLPSVTAVVANTTSFNPTTANLSIGTLTGTVAGTRTFFLGGSSTGNVVTGAIVNGSGGGTTQIQKFNLGTWTLQGANTYTGFTQVGEGTLSLTGSLASATLTMGGAASGTTAVGGTFSYDTAGTNTQTFTTTNVNSGGNAINVTNAANTLNLGALSRAAFVSGTSTWSTIDFGGVGVINTTTTTNANGILAAAGAGGAGGGYATFNGNTWAVAPASPGGAITGLSTYVNTFGTPLASAATTDNIDVAALGSNASGGLQTVNSLRFNDSSAPSTVDATNGLVLTSGGILVSSNVGNRLSTISGGTLQGAASRDLVIIQNNAANGLTISSVITDNTAATGIAKAGPGNLTLTGDNSFTGAFIISGTGTVVMSGNNAARPSGITGLTTVNRGAILQLQANANNTFGGVSTALSSEQTAGQPLILNNGSTLQLRSDDSVTFAGANNFGGVGLATFGIDVNNNGAGTGNTLTIAPNGFNVAQTTFNVTGGNNYSLAFGPMNMVAFADRSLNLNPTTASVTVNAGATGNSLTADNGVLAIFNLGGTSTGNVIQGAVTNSGNGTASTLNKLGTSTWRLNGVNTYTGATSIAGGSLVIGDAGQLGAGAYAGNIANSGTFNYASSATQTLSGVISGSGAVVHSGSGSLTLTGTNVYTGQTTVNGGGALKLNGNNASSPVALTLGTLDGIGRGGNVSVADNAANIIANGNGTTGTFTLGNLAFGGDATLNLSKSNSTSTASLTVGALSTTPANGTVTVNVPTGPIWATGSTYNLVGYQSFTGASSNFTLGSVAGLGARQTAALGSTGAGIGFITLTINGNTPVWTGAASGLWTTATIPNPFNWKLQTGGAPTQFLNNDQVIFDDTATGTTSVQIQDATVAPAAVTFSNSTKSYTLSSSNGNGITSGSVTKNGSGSLTITNANTYGGGTAFNAGTLNVNDASAIGTGVLTITGGTLNNTSGAPITLSTNNAQAWNGNFAFGGANDLNLGTGAVTLGTTTTVTSNGAGVLVVGGAISGTSLGITKAGTGTLALAGTNTYSGTTTINGGSIRLDSAGALQGTVVTSAVANGMAFSAGIGEFDVGGLSGAGNQALTDLGSGAVTLSVGGNGGSTTYSGSLSGSGALTKVGAGTLTLTGANAHGGGTNINGGLLNVGSTGALGAAGAISFGGGTLQYSTVNQSDYSSRFVPAQTYRVDTNGENVTWATGLTGVGGALVKSGLGALTLTGSNDFSGALTINANGGSVVLSGNNAGRFSGDNTTIVNNGATLQLQANAGNTVGTDSFALSGEVAGGLPLRLNTGSTLQLRSNDNVTFAGTNNFGGVGQSTVTIDVNNNGAGTGKTLSMALTGFNVAQTVINVTGGNGYSLELGPINMVGAFDRTITLNPTTANLTLGATTSLTSDTGVNAIFRLEGTSTGNTAPGAIVNGAGASVNSVIKANTGTWALSGFNTYSGATTVSGGTLLVNGTHAPATGGAYTVAAAGTLGGTGVIDLSAANSNVTVNGGLAPGASAGLLTFSLGTGSLDLSGATATNSGALKFELGAPSNPAASDSVLINTGVLNVGVLDMADFTFTNAGGLGVGSYKLFDAPSTVSGSIGVANGIAAGYTATLSINAAFDVMLNVTGLAADFNNSSSVTADDLTIWRNNFATGTTHAQGDADGDNDVDGDDFLVWQRQLGLTAAVAAGAAVPEPSTLALVVGVFAVAVATTRRARRAS